MDEYEKKSNNTNNTDNTDNYPAAKQKTSYYPGKFALQAFKGIEEGIHKIGADLKNKK